MNPITETIINNGAIQYKIPYYPREKQIELNTNMQTLNPNKYKIDAETCIKYIKLEPNLSSRYKFYAGQSYYDHGNMSNDKKFIELAIDWYKERIADDFGAFRVGKLPARTLGEKILKFFRDIIEFFKSFVQKPSLKEELFKAIEAGKFKDMTLPASVAVTAPEYMRIPGLTETQELEYWMTLSINSSINMALQTIKDSREIGMLP